MILLDLCAFFIVMFFLRAMFILKFGWFGTDTFYFLTIARKIRKYRRIPKKIEEVAVENDYTLPVLFPAFLAIFKPKSHKKLQLLGPAIEAIIGLILVIFCFYLTDNIFIASIAGLIYLLCPISFYQSVNLNYRVFGNLWLSISLILLYMYFSSNDYVFLILSIIFLTLVFLSHKLATQNIVIILILLSIVFLSVIPVLCILVATGMAILFSEGFFTEQIKDHIKLQIHFFEHGNPICGIKFHNPLQVIYWFPFVLLLPFVLLNITLTSANKFFLVWFLSMLIMTIFWLWGCEIHHLTYAVFPFSVLLSLAVSENNNIFGFDIVQLSSYILLIISLLIFGFLLIAFYRSEKIFGKYWYKFRSYSISGRHIRAFKFARGKLNRHGIIFSVPARYNYALMYFTGMKILGGQASSRNVKRTTLELPLFDWDNRKLSEIILAKCPFRYLFLDMDYLNRDAIDELVKRKAIKMIYSDDPLYFAEIIDIEIFRSELLRLPEIQKIKLRCIASAKDEIEKS